MLESLNLVIYAAVGFAISYLSCKVVWHTTPCGISYESKAISIKLVRNVVLGKV